MAEMAPRQGKATGPSIEFTELNRPTRFISDMRFRLDLPEISCDMKSLATPFDPNAASKFELTHEERRVPAEMHLPEFLGFEFGTAAAEEYQCSEKTAGSEEGELSDPESLETLPSLDEADYEILDAVDSVMHEKLVLDSETMLMTVKKKKQLPMTLKGIDPERWWIKKDGEEKKKETIRVPRTQRKSRKRKVRNYATKEAFLQSVERGFERGKHPPETRAAQLTAPFQAGPQQQQSMTQRKMRRAVAVYNVMPHEDDRGRSFCTVNLHNNCVADSDRLLKYEQKYSTQISENALFKELTVEPKSKQEAEVNKAIGFDNKYLGLIAPCYVQTSTNRTESVMGHEEQYLWIREYFYRKRKRNEAGKWKWAMRLDREKKIAELVPVEHRFITRKQKLRSVIPRPTSVQVINTEDASEDYDIF